MIQQFIAYLRVSTIGQGATGVSLSEQRLAISEYALRHNLRVSRWFIETRSAATRGRPVFRQVLQALKHRQAAGVIIHRIDRSTRNLQDWATLGELLDLGVDIRFVHDGLDLHSRGGRLAADIQAVIAADFVRNLREETRKGMRGRFRQGLYPLPAPLGYINNGRGRAKTLDPERSPLVRHAFDLYASGVHSLRSIQLETYMRGLRNTHGRSLSLNGVSKMLRNPFYAGTLRLASTGEDFPGIHEPLVTLSQFHQVQQLLRRRGRRTYRLKHAFRFQKELACTACNRCLIGERQKGHIYYRCHGCRGVCVREDRVEDAVRRGVVRQVPDLLERPPSSTSPAGSAHTLP